MSRLGKVDNGQKWTTAAAWDYCTCTLLEILFCLLIDVSATLSSLGVVGRSCQRSPLPEIATACLLAPAQTSSTKQDITSHLKGFHIPQ